MPKILISKTLDKRCYRKIIFFFNQNICCGYSKEPSQSDDSFEHPKHMLKIMGKKIFTILRWVYTCQNTTLLDITSWLKYAWWQVNPVPHDSAFWRLWNTMYLKISWKKSICSIGANAAVSIIFSKVFKTLLKFFWIFFNVV